MNPPLIRVLQVDAGTEAYLQWALRRVVVLELLRCKMSQRSLTKVYSPAAGVLVFLRCLDGDWRIRVTGSAVTGRQRLTSVNGTNVERLYVLKAGKLSKYGEAPYDASLSAVMSFDGSTVAGLSGNATLHVMRKAKADASAAIDTSHGVPSTTTPRAFQHGCLTNRQIQGTQDIPEDQRLGFLTQVALSKDGQLAVVRETLAGLPRIYSVGLSVDQTATTLALLASGIPQWVTDFYATLPIAHSLFRDTSSHENYAAGEVYALADVAALTAGNYTRFAPPTLFNFGDIEADSKPVLFQLGYDKFSDRLVLLASMPYVTSVTFVAPTTSATVGCRYELRAYNRATGAWDPVYAEQYSNIAVFNFDLSDSPENFVYDGVNSAVKLVQGLHMSYFATTDWFSIPYSARPAAYKGLLAMASVQNVSAAPYPVRLNAVQVGTSSSLDVVQSLAPGSVLTNTVWVGAWGSTTAPSAELKLSSGGTEGISGSATPGWQYWRNGASVQTITGSPPAANATSYATYGAVPASGFYFIDSVVGFSYKKAKFKAAVRTNILLTPGTPPGTLHVFGGTIIVPGIGTVPVNLANNNGFNQAGTLYHDTNNAAIYTPAQIDALFGVTGSTFVLDGTQYDMTIPGTSDSYAWVSATVDLAWDAKSSALKIKKTYATTALPVASRGPLAETIAGATTVSFTDSTLVQDEFLVQ